MPTARATGWRIRAGTWGVVSVTASYAVASLPTQADQTEGIGWTINGWRSTIPTSARRTVQADLSRKADGYRAWQWHFDYLTFGMMDHWLDTFLPSGMHSAAVTVMTYDESDTAVYLTAVIYRPAFDGQNPVAFTGGWRDAVFEFVKGVVIT